MTPVPAWFDATLPNGWSRLPHPAIYSQQAQSAADKANPDDLGGSYKPIVATKGDSAGYVGAGNKPWPYPGALLADGSPAVPGYADFRGDQGMCLIGPDAKFVRRGKVYTGWFVVSPGQGGHGVGLVNQFLVRHVETGLYMDATQQSMPPMGIANATVLGPDGKTQVPVPPWRPDDGRGYSMHDYNAIVPDRKRNRVLWPVGPAQSVGPQSNATLAFGMDGDGWPGPNPVSDPANGKDYFDTSGGAYPNGRNAVACTDCTRDEIYNSFPNSDFVNAVLIAVSSLAQGSKWRWLQVVAGNGDAQIGKASCVSFAMETEPWLVFFSEVSVSHCVILHRDYPIPGYPDRRKYWNVAFQPKGGDPNNVIPSKALDPAWAANVDNGIASTVVFDPVDRLFYAIVFCLDANVLMDVYRITPPAFDPSGADGAGSTFVQGIGGNEVVVPWITEKLAKDPQSVLELPTRGNSSGGFYPSHKTANVVWWYRPDGTRVKGIHFEHDPSRSPIFFRLA